jgi:hypothetical protein
MALPKQKLPALRALVKKRKPRVTTPKATPRARSANTYRGGPNTPSQKKQGLA